MGDSRGDDREDRGERKMNEIEETGRNKNIHPPPLPAARTAGLAQL